MTRSRDIVQCRDTWSKTIFIDIRNSTQRCLKKEAASTCSWRYMNANDDSIDRRNMGETEPRVWSGTKEQRQQTSGRKVRSRGGRGGLEWLAESIGQWVSFGEGRFDSTTRFLARSLETASGEYRARASSCRFRSNDRATNVAVVKGEESSEESFA